MSATNVYQFAQHENTTFILCPAPLRAQETAGATMCPQQRVLVCQGLYGAHANKTTTETTTSQICIFNNWHVICTLCTCNFNFYAFRCCSRPFHDVKWNVLQFCWRRKHLITNVIPGKLANILQAKRLGVFKIRWWKREVQFSDDVLAVVDVVQTEQTTAP